MIGWLFRWLVVLLGWPVVDAGLLDGLEALLAREDL